MTGKISPTAYLEFPCDNVTLLLLALSSTSRLIPSSLQESFTFLRLLLQPPVRSPTN